MPNTLPFEYFFQRIFEYPNRVAERDDALRRLALEQADVKKYKTWLDETVVDESKVSKNLANALLEIDQLKNSMGFGMDPWEKYWTTKLPRINVNHTHNEFDETYNIDVRNYYCIYDPNTPTFSGKGFDDIALNCLLFVQKNVVYDSDFSTYKLNDYWGRSYQTLFKKKGDCDDGSILLANILVKSGIPYWRVRINVGPVNGAVHAYVSYCRTTDNNWVVLDWCYWPNQLAIKDRPTHADERNYIDPARNFLVAFSWDMKYCYGREDTIPLAPKDLFQVNV